MKRRGFFKLLGAAAAAPAVAKEAEPAFTEVDYLFAVDRDNPTPTIDPEPLAQLWIPADKPRGLDSGRALQVIGDMDEAKRDRMERWMNAEMAELHRRLGDINTLTDLGIVTAEQARKLLDLP